MPEVKQPARFAVNVMRPRQAVIGVNITIVSFQVARLYRAAGGISAHSFDHRIPVRADMGLCMSLALLPDCAARHDHV